MPVAPPEWAAAVAAPGGAGVGAPAAGAAATAAPGAAASLATAGTAFAEGSPGATAAYYPANCLEKLLQNWTAKGMLCPNPAPYCVKKLKMPSVVRWNLTAHAADAVVHTSTCIAGSEPCMDYL